MDVNIYFRSYSMHPCSFWWQTVSFLLRTACPLSLGNEISLPSTRMEAHRSDLSSSELCTYNHVIGPGRCTGHKMSQLNIFPALASTVGKERACLPEISGAMKQESLEPLVTVFVATRKGLRMKSTQRNTETKATDS